MSETSEREVWVGLTRGEVAALLSGADTLTLKAARGKLRDAREADREQEAEDALPRCPDCRRGPELPEGEECPICREDWEHQRMLSDLDRAAYAEGYREGQLAAEFDPRP